MLVTVSDWLQCCHSVVTVPIQVGCFLLSAFINAIIFCHYSIFKIFDICFRYLLYDVNPGEGFNLRRDVYIRIAHLVKVLNGVEPWVLILPPWGRLYHWRSPVEQNAVPWATFFDLPSLARHVPVMEFENFLQGLFCKKFYLFKIWYSGHSLKGHSLG